MGCSILTGLQFTVSIPPEHDDDESDKSQHGSDSREADHIRDEETVLSCRRVVVIAKE